MINSGAVVKSSSKCMSWLNFFIVSLLGSFLIALFGKVRIFLPFTPIPIVLQMQLVFLLAIFFGPKKAAFATLLFMIQAQIGFPVLPTSIGFFTIARGYYIGYFFAALIIGMLVHKQKRYTKIFMVTLLGNAIVYLCGFFVFAIFVGTRKAFLLGVLPFVLPDIFKNLVVIQVLKVYNRAKK